MACVHPAEDGSRSEFYEYSKAPVVLVNGGRILDLLKDTELPPASQPVSHCVCTSVDDLLWLSQEPSAYSEPNK